MLLEAFVTSVNQYCLNYYYVYKDKEFVISGMKEKKIKLPYCIQKISLQTTSDNQS